MSFVLWPSTVKLVCKNSFWCLLLSFVEDNDKCCCSVPSECPVWQLHVSQLFVCFSRLVECIIVKITVAQFLCANKWRNTKTFSEKAPLIVQQTVWCWTVKASLFEHAYAACRAFGCFALAFSTLQLWKQVTKFWILIFVVITVIVHFDICITGMCHLTAKNDRKWVYWLRFMISF